ncbi:MAG TPA: hypothetical protein VMU17_03935 [Elusimicrobiota bacterium]|nr:hypothetical protein [Elusimicrobiota bacterium]
MKLLPPSAKADPIIPLELGRKVLALVERTHQTIDPRGLPSKIATRRNLVAVAMPPEAFAIPGAASSIFKIRISLWVFATGVLLGSWLLTWWLVTLSGPILIIERVLAAKERRFYILLAAMLLSAEMLASDFAGWGTAHPMARQASIDAFGSEGGAQTEWLDYYLPRRAELGAVLVKAFGPIQLSLR